MNPPIAAIDALGLDGNIAGVSASTPVREPVAQFGNWFTQELGSVNAQMLSAEHSVQQLAAGTSTNVHDTMIQLEQARLSFQLAMQVRTRVLEAYQEVMRMQV